MSIVSFLNYREFIITRKTTEHYLSDVAGQCVGAHTCGGRLGGTMGMAHGPPFASAGSSHVGARLEVQITGLSQKYLTSIKVDLMSKKGDTIHGTH